MLCNPIRWERVLEPAGKQGLRFCIHTRTSAHARTGARWRTHPQGQGFSQAHRPAASAPTCAAGPPKQTNMPPCPPAPYSHRLRLHLRRRQRHVGPRELRRQPGARLRGRGRRVGAAQHVEPGGRHGHADCGAAAGGAQLPLLRPCAHRWGGAPLFQEFNIVMVSPVSANGPYPDPKHSHRPPSVGTFSTSRRPSSRPAAAQTTTHIIANRPPALASSPASRLYTPAPPQARPLSALTSVRPHAQPALPQRPHPGVAPLAGPRRA